MRNSQTMRLTIFGFILILTAGVKVFAAGGDLDLTFMTGVSMLPANTVETIAVQADGRALVGGYFTVVNGRSFSGLARLNVDGTLDRSFDIGTGFSFAAVQAIAVQPDGKILVGGNFTFFNGTTRPYLVRLNANGSLETSFNAGGAGANGAVEAIVLQPNGQILIGGVFSTYNGATANHLARLNSSGSLDTTFAANLGTGFDITVSKIALQTNGQIVVGGVFTSLNGATANRIARVNSNGTPDTAFLTNTGAGFSNSVLAVALQTDGRILVGGSFMTFNGMTAIRLARLNTDGTLDGSLTAPLSNGNIAAIAVQPDGRFFVMNENFATFGSGANLRRGIARLNASDGSIDTSFDAGLGPNGTSFHAVALQTDGTILVGGNFSAFDDIPRSALAKLNADGSVDANYTPVAGQPARVETIVVLPNRQILIGGNFNGVNGSPRNGIARLKAGGLVDETFNANAAVGLFGSVSAIAVQPDGKILFSGGGINNSNFRRLNADGSIDATFNASVSGALSAIIVQPDGKIVIGGEFNNVNGVFGINRIARLNADGTTDATFNSGTGFSLSVEDMVLQANGQILVVGSFTSYNGATGINRIARLNSDGTLDTAFTANTGTGFDTSVYTLVLQTDGKILAGGNFNTFNGASSNRIVRLNSNGTRDASFNVGTGFDGNVYDLAIQTDGRILAVGNFRIYNGTARIHLARINTDGSLDTTLRSGVAVNNDLAAVALQSDAQFIVGGDLRSYDDIPRFGIARLSVAGGICRNKFDDDFDGKADFIVYRPSDSTFYTLRSNGDDPFQMRARRWGTSGDRPFLFNSFRVVSGVNYPELDYAVFRPSDGYWHILAGFESFPAMTISTSYQWGLGTDLPVPGDYDGDCSSDIAVWRPSNGVWYIARPLNPISIQWGQNGDKPLVADFDGDGKTDFAVFRASGGNGFWYVMNSRDNSTTSIQFGFGTDVPVPADYDGDGKADIAVFRPSNGVWYLLQSGSGNSLAATQWGFGTDTPVPADYDGDAVADIAVYRDGNWYILQSSQGFKAVQWGTAQDIPMPAALRY